MQKKSILLPIFLIVAVDVLGLTIVLPLLPFYAEHYGASPFLVGMLVTTYAAFQLISGPILGKISDKVGRRPMLLVSQVGTLIGFIILAFSTHLWMIFLSRVIDGITAGNLSLAQAYISDVTEPKDRAKSFGVIGIAFGLGFLVGPAISGYLSQYGYHYPVFAASALSACSIVATYFLLPDARPVHHAEGADEPAGRRLSLFEWGKYAEFFRRPGLANLLTQFFGFCLAFSLFISGFALFAERQFTYHGHAFGPKEVGYIYAYSGFLGLILQGGLIGRLVERFGEEKLVRSGFFAAMLGYTILGFTHTIPQLLIASTIASYGTGILRPCLTSLISRTAHRKEQGVVLGLTQSLNSMGSILAPMIAGALIEHLLLKTWAITAAVVCLIGLILSAQLVAKPREANL